MNVVRLSKDGLLYEKNWNNDKQAVEYSLVTDDTNAFSVNTFSCLLHAIEIEEGATLDDLFFVCSKLKPYLSVLLRGYWFLEYMDEWERVRFDSKHDDSMQCLYLHNDVDINNFGGGPTKLEQSSILSVSALKSSVIILEDGTLKETKENEDWLFYGIDFLPLSSYITLPLVLAKKIHITRLVDDKYTQEEYGWEPHVTLLDVIRSIFFEISFYGGPSDTKKASDDMGERVKAAFELISEFNKHE